MDALYTLTHEQYEKARDAGLFTGLFTTAHKAADHTTVLAVGAEQVVKGLDESMQYLRHEYSDDVARDNCAKAANTIQSIINQFRRGLICEEELEYYIQETMDRLDLCCEGTYREVPTGVSIL